MKTVEPETPEPSEASIKQHTGQPRSHWFAQLDAAGGTAAGRRALVNHLYGEAKLDEWWSTTLVVEYERERGQKEKDGKPKGYSICATKTIAAPLDVVFGAFGDAKLLDRWLGSGTSVEFRDGGRMKNGDGDAATIARIRPNKDLRMDWQGKLASGTAVEVLFADKGKGKTGITLNHTRIQSRREADQIRAGWGAAFDALKGLLEKA
jgi:uncharacterized protein YndB with AHSA1/START domain